MIVDFGYDLKDFQITDIGGDDIPTTTTNFDIYERDNGGYDIETGFRIYEGDYLS